MYEPVIGLEIRAQLLTKTKLCCGSSGQYGKLPNSQTCPVCLGFPGALPVLNQEAVAMANLSQLVTNILKEILDKYKKKLK